MSTEEIIKHKLTIRDRMIKCGNMKLLDESFKDDGSQSITELVAKHGRPQLMDVKFTECEKSFTETLAEICRNNPGLVETNERVKQVLKERGLL